MNRQDLRIQFYGSEDARVYDSDELHLMEEYANLRLSEQKEKHEQDGKIICRMLFQSSSITANVLQLTFRS